MYPNTPNDEGEPLTDSGRKSDYTEVAVVIIEPLSALRFVL